jgi:hypothetical protein
MPLSASVAIRGAEADAPCIRALFALTFAARGGDLQMAALGVRLRAALAVGYVRPTSRDVSFLAGRILAKATKP